MKIATYSSTPGLNCFPKRECFSVYRTTHKRLMREDAGYRKIWYSYVVGIVCVAVVPVGTSFAGGALGVLLSGLAVLVSVAGILYLALRQQNFMNGAIGAELPHRSPEVDR